eukprot:scaffold8088_cov17-Prasinocladus_malaysianus.AAC.1
MTRLFYNSTVSYEISYEYLWPNQYDYEYELLYTTRSDQRCTIKVYGTVPPGPTSTYEYARARRVSPTNTNTDVILPRTFYSTVPVLRRISRTSTRIHASSYSY